MKLIAFAAIAACAAVAAQSIRAEDGPFTVANFEAGDVQLFMDQGICKGQAHRALGVNKDGSESTVGCWLPAGPYIQVVWLKGTIDRIPVKDFKRPETL